MILLRRCCEPIRKSVWLDVSAQWYVRHSAQHALPLVWKFYIPFKGALSPNNFEMNHWNYFSFAAELQNNALTQNIWHTSWKLQSQKLIYLRELHNVSHTTGHWLHKIQKWDTKVNHVTVLNKGKMRRMGCTKNCAWRGHLAVESALLFSST
jgi:hypothetical protein